MPARVLLIEDDEGIARLVVTLLSRAGFEVLRADDGRGGLRKVHEAKPDVVLLDVGLPELDGWEVLERLRDISEVPVLMLTARTDSTDKVRGLRGGADDYLTKPFDNGELLARVEALLRRPRLTEGDGADVVVDGALRIDTVSRSVRLGDREVASRLRRKLGWDADGSPIEAVRGFGYRYRKAMPS
jgi:DNA-binding response OmpR family regulator